MNISLVVAFDNNFAIGNNNDLLWHLPNDLKHFKALTTGKTIVMGRNTYESIGKPLPNRTNIIISRNTNYEAKGCIVVNSLDAAIAYSKTMNVDELMIIGGGQLYMQSFNLCTTLYVTHVNCATVADVHFPIIDYSQWNIVSSDAHEVDEKHKYNYTFVTYTKK
ncbi:MAG: dihydrofolate reductase [Bacteroidia bacterium]|nr:dihydrofolate reductase [Bacteroidia bacterium]